jgi:hypothetical protein
VPTNKAWKPIEPDLMVASNAVIADTLKYHVTPKALQVSCQDTTAAAAAAAAGTAVAAAALLLLLILVLLIMVYM